MAATHTIDITGLLSGSRQELWIDEQVPVEPFEGIAFDGPVRMALRLRRVDRLLEIEGSLDARASGACDGCLGPVAASVHVDVEERLDPGTDRNGDPFGEGNVLVGDRLDLADLAQQLAIAALPIGLRCSDECKGLCAACGGNRNAGECSCENGDTGGQS